MFALPKYLGAFYSAERHPARAAAAAEVSAVSVELISPAVGKSKPSRVAEFAVGR